MSELSRRNSTAFQKLYDKVRVEINAFREGFDKSAGWYAYNQYYKIGFFQEVSDLLTSYLADEYVDEKVALWLSEKDSPLFYLYCEHLQDETPFSYDWVSIGEFIYECYERACEEVSV